MGKEHILEKLNQLNKERDEIYASISDLPEKALYDQSYGWSILQVFVHLNMSELGSVRYMEKKMQAGQGMSQFSLVHKLRYALSRNLLQSGLKWKAPSVISKPSSDYTIDQIKEEWSKTREAIRDYIEKYPSDLLSRAVFKHPFAGRLNLEAALDSFIFHQRHHVHQLRRIRKKIGH